MERLSGLDASFLYLETPAQLLHVSGLIELDPSTIPGGYSFAALSAELDRRVRSMPEFRRTLRDNRFNLDHPVWVDDPDFDIDRHLHRIAVPEPGGRAELAELYGHLAGQPLDRTRPLWEMWVIEGLPDGKIAVMAKMHHAGADGVTGANLMSRLCGLTPDESPSSATDNGTATNSAGDGGDLAIALGGLAGFVRRPLELARLLPSATPLLTGWISRARRGAAMPAPFTAPRLPFNANITRRRIIAYTQLDLNTVKQVKNAFGVKVNDVVLTLVASALRSYLAERDELPDTSLVAMVPVSVHASSDRPGTNQVSAMFTQLRSDIADPAERLRAGAEANDVAKLHNNAIGATLLQDWAQFSGPAVFGTAMRVYADLRLAERHPVIHNLVVSNVPGPPVPLYFLGAHITAMYPLGPVFHGAGLNVTVMSLEDRLNVGLIACQDLVPDLWSLVDDFQHGLDELAAAAN
ncbi:WS/DGAT/MGAT family O-acyltransferase [Skermania piniformis]|uniref:Diacylglycerol O-acyltransferase n=1 Tax=Skermania pinensis TaxID=39122 RepID=A0ABX8SHQ5_9ACTN|nr:wax ester/triacylglycerol synthase family O-acyltransferase [Skermania piniformis]QXQ15211.1 wax ester/triacylglycerol synthase family O-acyltransferase [Skermania piniformis]